MALRISIHHTTELFARIPWPHPPIRLQAGFLLLETTQSGQHPALDQAVASKAETQDGSTACFKSERNFERVDLSQMSQLARLAFQ